jgi:hypothetical protein
MNRLLPLLVSGASLLVMSACTPTRTVLDKPPGKYEKTTSSTSADGTTVEKTNSASVGYDANGNKQAVVKTQTTVDPPGLFNKSTTTSTEVVK